MNTLLSRSGLLPSVIDEMFNKDRFFDFDLFNGGTMLPARWVPAVNILEMPKEFKITFSVPGMAKNDFKINVENEVLTVSAEKKEEKRENNERFTRREYWYGSFKRSFNLPEGLNGEKIDAHYEDGILSLMLPKKDEFMKKSKVKEIAVH